MDDSAALTGITVITLAVNLPGPLAAARLTAMGARVIKVEPPSGDPLQHAAPQYYRELAAHQEVMVLDLKTDSDRATLDSLAAGAHVLLTSMRPRAAESLGLPSLVERHGLVHVEIVGFNGDRADVPGHDLTYQAAHGSLVPGTMPTVPIADILGGERAVTAGLAGLRQREQDPAGTSGGIVQRVALDDAAHWAAGMARHGLTSPGAHLGGGSPFYQTYATADGHIAIGAVEPHFASTVGQMIGSDHDTLTRAFAARPTQTWMELAHTHDLPIEPILNPSAPRLDHPGATS
ncbi:CoA transferase [Brevibacterium jeotgali]|uniref:Crotonobetainyl-CoA:carnitine CoA-transferase CaiB n=1 Tax=Brevibacterium jeotgali TaxID=1262550 RepID=A0A2H1L2I8_9MICO|nr:CoA transferase [Brevibacterium jeotgali]TWC02341.1 crotonobetainyl-CoA:carnitine CoA-transferase CaiB-like acyl-CoA transferase [Brevibacterium jeotgali]SMY11134.1 Crotonobetainyl-CoA:carnitine CoA-transferase CaiB [Brevibacterium jeotgali]